MHEVGAPISLNSSEKSMYSIPENIGAKPDHESQIKKTEPRKMIFYFKIQFSFSRIRNASIYKMFILVDKGSVKLIEQVKIAHSFLQSVLNQFHFIILSLPLYFCIWLSKNFSKPTSKNGKTSRFNPS